jgi:hypothetical protein
MKTHKAKRVEITIEAIMSRRLTDALTEAGVTGYTILPVLGGSGRSGAWNREGQVSRAAGMVQVICIIRPERLCCRTKSYRCGICDRLRCAASRAVLTDNLPKSGARIGSRP